MRYTLPVLAILLISLALACGDETSTSPDAQATIDAAIARINATLEAQADGMGPTPTATPAAAPVTDTPTPSPTVVTTLPPTPEPESQQSPTATAAPPPEALTQVRNWEYARQNVPEAAARIAALPWIADGMEGSDEFNAAERLVNIAIDAPETLDVLLNAHSIRERLSPLDLPATLSLQRMAQNRPDRLAQLTGADWFRDGLTDAEAAIVAALYERAGFQSPEFDSIVSNPGVLAVEIASATNRAGEIVPVAVIRSGGAPPDSPVIAVAQRAVPFLEEMFDAPFPTPAIVVYVTQYVASTAAGTNYQTHVTLKPELDTNERPDFGDHAIFHEIAHYYLYAHPTWYAEGGAEFAASYAQHIAAGAPIEATNSPCAVTTSLFELERLLPADAGNAGAGVDPDLWRCNYSLGERLMLALYHQLGEERFLQGWRELYHTVAEQPSYPSQFDFQNEVELRVAWLRAGGRLMQPDLEQIWDQWYRGAASTAIDGAPDPTPPNPNLFVVNGRIDRAYLSLTQLGGAVDGFSASDVDGWVYLTIEYSHHLAGNPQNLNLQVVEYYQDGFAYSRRSVDFSFEPQYSGGTKWISVGPSPPNRWAPGRYWAYVYDGGRKVAEVEFEVTP